MENNVQQTAHCSKCGLIEDVDPDGSCSKCGEPVQSSEKLPKAIPKPRHAKTGDKYELPPHRGEDDQPHSLVETHVKNALELIGEGFLPIGLMGPSNVGKSHFRKGWVEEIIGPKIAGRVIGDVRKHEAERIYQTEQDMIHILSFVKDKEKGVEKDQYVILDFAGEQLHGLMREDIGHFQKFDGKEHASKFYIFRLLSLCRGFVCLVNMPAALKGYGEYSTLNLIGTNIAKDILQGEERPLGLIGNKNPGRENSAGRGDDDQTMSDFQNMFDLISKMREAFGATVPSDIKDMREEYREIGMNANKSFWIDMSSTPVIPDPVFIGFNKADIYKYCTVMDDGKEEKIDPYREQPHRLGFKFWAKQFKSILHNVKNVKVDWLSCTMPQLPGNHKNPEMVRVHPGMNGAVEWILENEKFQPEWALSPNEYYQLGILGLARYMFFGR